MDRNEPFKLSRKGFSQVSMKEKLVKFDQFNDIVELSKYRKLENKYAKQKNKKETSKE